MSVMVAIMECYLLLDGDPAYELRARRSCMCCIYELGGLLFFQLKSQLKGRGQLEARSASDDMDIPVAF